MRQYRWDTEKTVMWCPGCRRGTKRGLAAHSLKWQKHTATHFLRLEILSFLWAPSLPSFFIPHHNLIISSFFSRTCCFHYTNKSWTQHLPKCTTDSCTLMDKPRSSNDIFLSFTSVVGFFITNKQTKKLWNVLIFTISAADHWQPAQGWGQDLFFSFDRQNWAMTCGYRMGDQGSGLDWSWPDKVILLLYTNEEKWKHLFFIACNVIH